MVLLRITFHCFTNILAICFSHGYCRLHFIFLPTLYLKNYTNFYIVIEFYSFPALGLSCHHSTYLTRLISPSVQHLELFL